MAEPSANPQSSMIGCPVCGTDLEPWQINCHGCGQSISSFEIPIIKGDATFEPDLMKAYKKWMNRGKSAFKNSSFDEAHACFAEALKRVHGLSTKRSEEMKARQKLADAFVKLNKINEAIEQLVRAANLADSEEQKKLIQSRIDHLNRQLSAEHSHTEAKYRQLRSSERLSVPLYCVTCNRLMSESEVYKFRSEKQTTAKCICGFIGVPVTVEVLMKVSEPPPVGPPLGVKKAALIEAAHQPVKGGRDRRTAIWLAVILGNFGIHKFYLGERASGVLYLCMCWTLVPWLVALFEAVHIAQMSRVSFNLVYNIEDVVKRLPADLVFSSGDSGVFSMLVREDPDDLVDAWSQEDEVASVVAQEKIGNSGETQ